MKTRLALICLVGFFAGCANKKLTIEDAAVHAPTPLPENVVENQEPFTASFEIYTLGTKRIFTDSKYHQQSTRVYLEELDPSIVHVTTRGVTWQEFFNSLPMELDSDCLITGTGQKFCSGDTGTLTFYINGTADTRALSRPIVANDTLVVRYE